MAPPVTNSRVSTSPSTGIGGFANSIASAAVGGATGLSTSMGDRLVRNDQSANPSSIGFSPSNNAGIVKQATDGALEVEYSVSGVVKALKEGNGQTLVQNLKKQQGDIIRNSSFGLPTRAVNRDSAGNVESKPNLALVESSPLSVGSIYDFIFGGNGDTHSAFNTAGQVLYATLIAIGVDPSGTLGSSGTATASSDIAGNLQARGISQDIIDQASQVNSSDAAEAKKALDNNRELNAEVVALSKSFEGLNQARTNKGNQSAETRKEMAQMVSSNGSLSQPKSSKTT